jgi:hypothetical protein
MEPGLVHAWLTARLKNCQRIAQTKTGQDRDAWLMNAAFIAAAIGLLEAGKAAEPGLTPLPQRNAELTPLPSAAPEPIDGTAETPLHQVE